MRRPMPHGIMGNWRPGLDAEASSGSGTPTPEWSMGADVQDWMLHSHHALRGLHPSGWWGLEVRCKIHFSRGLTPRPLGQGKRTGGTEHEVATGVSVGWVGVCALHASTGMYYAPTVGQAPCPGTGREIFARIEISALAEPASPWGPCPGSWSGQALGWGPPDLSRVSFLLPQRTREGGES